MDLTSDISDTEKFNDKSKSRVEEIDNQLSETEPQNQTKSEQSISEKPHNENFESLPPNIGITNDTNSDGKSSEENPTKENQTKIEKSDELEANVNDAESLKAKKLENRNLHEESGNKNLENNEKLAENFGADSSENKNFDVTKSAIEAAKSSGNLAESLKVDNSEERKTSKEMEQDVRRMAELKEQRERDTQEVKKRELLPSFNSLLHGKCVNLLREAEIFLQKGEKDEALTKLTKLVMIQPASRPSEDGLKYQLAAADLAEPYKLRAEIYLDMCDFQSAILNYKKVCHLQPEEAGHFERLAFIYFFYGQVLFDQGQFPEALECFSRAAEMRPDTVGYHTRSIACLASLQRHGECLALVNRRIEAESDNPDLFVMRARLHQLFGNSTLCYYDVRDALELEPELEQALELREALFEKAIQLKNQAIVLMLEDKLPEAQSKISQAIDNDPTVAELHVLRGAIYRRLGKFNSAVDDFLLALDKTDHDESSSLYRDAMRQLILSYNDFAVECFGKGYFEEAISLLNKSIRAEKNEKGLYINRGVIFNEFAIMDYFERRYLEAEEKFTHALHHNPKVSQYYISRARVRHLLDFKKGAREDVLCAMHLSPNNEELFSLIARLFPGKQIAEIKSSALYVATVKQLQTAFQISAPKKPPHFLRPLSSASTTTKLAENLSNEIQILVGPSPTSSRSIQGQRSARSQRSQRSLTEQRKKKSSTGVTTTSQRVSETRNTSSKLGRDSGSLRNESSIGMADPVSRSGRKTADEPDYETGRESVSMFTEISSNDFIERKKQLNEDVRKMYQTAHQLGGSLAKRSEVLVNANHLRDKHNSKPSSRWSSSKRNEAKIDL
ncbi:tetratricopeptide repeat protein 16-like isoform X2 [Symsagittifera roscoffensis]|uniref:tetratricopeptide repeat protein 16-like isoform X2 n=1 Tax=Symsagittifera roscoffensis TaxID=84072 RepID=UPI00307CAAB1